MITKLAISSIYDQEAARDFWTRQVGFEVREERSLGPKGAWLELAPPGADDLLPPPIDQDRLTRNAAFHSAATGSRAARPAAIVAPTVRGRRERGVAGADPGARGLRKGRAALVGCG